MNLYLTRKQIDFVLAGLKLLLLCYEDPDKDILGNAPAEVVAKFKAEEILIRELVAILPDQSTIS